MPPVRAPDYAEVFRSVPGNYLLLDPEFTIVGVTDAYLAATLTTRQQLLGRWLFEAFPDNPGDPGADGVRNLRRSLERVRSERRPDRMPVQKYDIRRPAAEGGGFEERYWSPLNTPVLDAAGAVRYIVHWVEDVTEFVRLKLEMQESQAALDGVRAARAGQIDAGAFLGVEALEAHRRLTESERRYRFLADAIPQLIWTADASGLVDYCNARWLAFTGLPFDRLQGNNWHEVIHPEDRERTVAAWVRAVAGVTPEFRIEHRLRRRDGTWRWALTSAVPYGGAAGTASKWFGTSTDIHDRVLAEQQLEQAHRLQAAGKLAGGVAHEVNNMMAVVIGLCETMLGTMAPENPDRADVAEVLKAGQRAAGVTRQLLAFSRQQILQPTVLDLAAVTRGLGYVLQRLLGSDRHLEVHSGAAPVTVRADQGQVEQVLINLVINARDATGTGGRVSLEVDEAALDQADLLRYHEVDLRPGRFARLAVRDNGRGMGPEVLERVFEPFFTTKPAGEGTGLGLSMVYGVAKQSGGFVHIDSAPDRGTVVALYLPLVDEAPAAAVAGAETAPGRGEVILVVEDEPMVSSMTQRLLTASGYTVYHAPNGRAALEFLAAGTVAVDLVVTDIVMPYLNGRELADRLAEYHPRLPVLFMSGHSDSDILQRGVILDGSRVLQKPFTPDAMLAAVRGRLDAPRDRRLSPPEP